MNKEILEKIDKITNYVLRYGSEIKVDSYNYNNNESGSDKVIVIVKVNRAKSLKLNDLEIKVFDFNRNHSYGTNNIDWENSNNRRVEFYSRNELIVTARKTLSGEKGWSGLLGSSIKEIKPTNW